MTEIKPEDIEILEAGKVKGWLTKASMKKLARVYNRYIDSSQKISNCMCNKISRKVYHNIIMDWYGKNSN